MGSISIVLADDHAVVRSALRLLLEAEDDFEVVAEAGDVDSTVRFVHGHRPDVLILDLNMPGGPSLPMVPALRRDVPNTGIVVLTMQSEPAYAREAMQSGVLGYVLKEAVITSLSTRCASPPRGRPTYSRSWARSSRPTAGTPPTVSAIASSRSSA